MKLDYGQRREGVSRTPGLPSVEIDPSLRRYGALSPTQAVRRPDSRYPLEQGVTPVSRTNMPFVRLVMNFDNQHVRS